MNADAPKITRHAALRVLAAIADEREMERQWLTEQINACKDVKDALATAREEGEKSILAEVEQRIASEKEHGEKRIKTMNSLFSQFVENENARIRAYEARIAVIGMEEKEVATEQAQYTEDLSQIAK